MRQSLSLDAAQQRMALLNGLGTALSSLSANLGLLAVLAVAIPLVGSSRLPGVYLAVVALAALSCFEAVQPLPLAAQYLESSLQAARRLFEVADAQPVVTIPADPRPLPQTFGLEIRDLSFCYPFPDEHTPGSDREAWRLALDRLSLPAGKHVAVVGPTGSGKTTLVNLLLRFWDFQDGSIRLDGCDIRGLDPLALRGRMGVVAQQTYLFNATLRENIVLGRPGASQEEVERAARRAQIHEFILRLPQGYETWIGEQGLRLSAGERQRIAIARALLKDAPFLILDEPTANLDAVNEKLVVEAIHTLMQDRTTLMITHRLVGMGWMDEILVLQGGRIVERGTHLELLQAGGSYNRMWGLQRVGV
jgi:ABC-type multidrug transport system fused ATPase/permease subunit